MSPFVVPQPEMATTVASRATRGASRRMGLGSSAYSLGGSICPGTRDDVCSSTKGGVHLHRSALSGKLVREEVAMQVRDGMSEVSVTVGPAHTPRQAARRWWSATWGRRWSSTTRRRRRGSSPSATFCYRSGRGRTPTWRRSAAHMTESVITAAPDWSLEHAAAEMSRRGIRHLVVFEERRGDRHPLDARHRPRLDFGRRHLRTGAARQEPLRGA